ncbi:MAG: hypothetical protein CM15mV149_040 [uncultured marine virus]|nr:MAG: hypothetical protein CM15mV149_040 [uncultured marine virus]
MVGKFFAHETWERGDHEDQSDGGWTMIKVRKSGGVEFVNVLNIVNVCGTKINMFRFGAHMAGSRDNKEFDVV